MVIVAGLLGSTRRPHTRTLGRSLARTVWRHRDGRVKLSWRRRSIHRKRNGRALLGRPVDRRAIGPAGHQAIPHLAVAVELVRQDPADDEEDNDHAECHQGTTLAAVGRIRFCHVKAFDGWRLIEAVLNAQIDAKDPDQKSS